ncbi:MAG: YdaS family helix-turn-helix protein [Rouxiella aceris]|uniref:transcriptional regulator n=1 Tax=Rouxiella aceris TaxID=2703884 RepID=UPI0028508B5C|nr:YdaS family helix-turn-helix protein [Rouxiella aceris]MDR3431076.1 YdaS family helix-turn-helix protein [Rouxiella aceris]
MNHVIEKAISITGSQSELGRRIGVGQSTISKWLNGAEISSRYISALAAATDGKISQAEILSSLERPDLVNPTDSAA